MLVIKFLMLSLLINRKARGKLVKLLVRVSMLRLLLFMHHIALYTPYIAHFNVAHLLHIWVDHTEPKMKIQAEQALGVSVVH
jgi:hypothetical protein